jgi:hypothetical protein
MTHVVAQTIFRQLGGRRFRLTTGARDLVGSANALSFQLPPGSRDGINGVRIVYERDLYTVEFWRMGERFADRVLIHKAEEIGAEDLGRIFGDATGLEMPLPASFLLEPSDDSGGWPAP